MDKRAGELSKEELYGTEWENRMNFMEETMGRLDASGLFGTGEEREGVVISVEQQPPDGNSEEYHRALQLNPPSALLSEYLPSALGTVVLRHLPIRGMGKKGRR